MKDESLSPLHRMEKEVLAEGQEWMKKRMEERLRELAENEGEVFSPQPHADAPSSAAPCAPDDDLRPRRD